MAARDIAKFTISNLDSRVDAANLARFLDLTSSASRSSVRVHLDPSTERCTGRGLVSVPESRAKQLLSYNGRIFCGQPIMIYPVENEGSTSHRKMDSSARKSEPPGNDTRADSLSRHDKSEHATNGSIRKVYSPVRKIKSEPSDRSARHKTSPHNVKTEPDTESARARPHSSSRHDKHEPAISVNKPKVDPLSKYFKIELEDKSDRSHSSGFKSDKSNVGVKTETVTSKSEGVSAGSTTSRSTTMDSKEVSTWLNDGAAPSRRPYRLVDISANLTHRKYAEDMAQVIQRSKAAGVQKVIVTPLNLRGSEEALKLCREYPGYIYCTVGVHPHEAKSWRSSTFDRLEYLARQPGCVAIGECGLDFNRDYSPRDQQLDVFEKQVQLACKVHKPMLLHEREAHEAFLKILNKYQAALPAVVCHCFTGRRNEALTYLSMGFYIGITGYLWKDTSNDGVRSLLYEDEIPVDKILLETDSPFMYPFIGRGRFPQHALDRVSPGSRQFLDCCGYQRNEPCAMPVIAELVAGCMRRSPSELADITTKNALRFFNLAM